jgi:hypothetical protein
MRTVLQGTIGAVSRALRLTLVAVAAIAVASSCAKRTATSSGSSEKIPLLVNNRGYYDVTVYAVRSPGGAGARIGNVSGGSTASLSVRFADLQAGGRMVLRVRAIGARREWLSPALSVGTGATARLNVFSTNSGDMSQSTLYADY